MDYKKVIYEKYLPKMEYIIRVLEGCETVEQAAVCSSWMYRVFVTWNNYEDRNTEDFNLSCDMAIGLDNLLSLFNAAYDRKREELSKNEEN